jgi:hypothetical protein
MSTGHIQQSWGEARAATIPRGLTATLFVAALVGFLLPFGTVSCGTPVGFTGAELATMTVPSDGYVERDFAEQVESNGSAVALLGLVAIAVGLGLAAAQLRGWGVAAVTGLFLLLLLPWIAVFELVDEMHVHAGYFLSVGALVGVVAARRADVVAARRAAGRRVWPAVLAGIALSIPVALTTLLCIDGVTPT